MTSKTKSKQYYELEAQGSLLKAHNDLVASKLKETLTIPSYKQLNDELLRLKDVVAIMYLAAAGAKLTDQERLEIVDGMSKASNLSVQLVERMNKLQGSPSGGNAMKLPEMKLPNFKGELLEWKAFWASFDALIHSRSNLESVVKFTYLNSYLSGEPKDLIKALAVTPANYTVAVGMLQDRYADDQKLLHSLLHQFHHLPSPRHDYCDIKAFHTKFVQLKEQIEGISSLTGSELMIKSIVIQKLNRTTYEYVVNTLRRFDFSLVDLMDTLRFLIDRWEYEQIISNENAQVKATYQNTDVSTKSKRTNETSSVNNIVCQLCKLEHRAVDCTKYKTFNSRRDRVRTLRLCFNCLRKGHVTKDCLSNSRYRKCGSMHHTALCFGNTSNNSSNVPSNTSNNNSNVTIANAL